ncbi:quinone oxidoreductase family protein [Streptantibioticus cattleyicolor]|uniref:Putative oxidoreductase n=2 Tax=Streptantibioticus cattleyicolor TaxID=29303 RepID=F8JND2_STREN|nr:zinc-binding alcohol dehydrogenase family protein [Streptantibioticus cattleyicolor]AEW99106.1 putative oxidoreductase [Streptantibioticus cattleyicolor NRRL 8057 = DSM 46488]CAD18972.1 putative oxidoreductase [Streptantibioticus cattleyicolor]CCB71849.1 putative oxidoreductase [Streptantibioticus cattleyicolor NRRL 8057 = DSM 46488]
MTLPTETWAVRIHRHGGPEVLVHERLPLPPLGPADVLVAVDTASVSGWDVKYRRGLPPGARLPGRERYRLPLQLGREAAGTVLATGPEAAGRFRPGDRVVAVVHPENPRAPETVRGLGNLSTGIALPGHQAPGGYARYLICHQDMWLPLPSGVDLEQAAVTLWPYATCHRVLRDRLRVALGETLLVCGATGAMGLAALRLARLTGVRVIAMTRYRAKERALRTAGADEVVVAGDPRQACEAVRALTGGEGVDHAVDFTGSAALLRLAVDSLRLGGRLCPAATQRPPGPLPVTTGDLTRLEITVYGIRGARHRDALRVLALLGDGSLPATPIAARFPLSRAGAAHEFLEHNTTAVGRVVLKPGW